MIDYKKEFHSENLYIRPSDKEDVEAMIEQTSDPAMWVYFTADLSDKEELKKWLMAGIEDVTRVPFTVIEKDSNTIIGATSIGNISLRDRRAEIGWTWLGKAYQGAGINYKVKLVLLEYLFEECEMERVELKTDVLNMPARKAVEKIGFVEEGVLRSHTQMIRNRRRDTIFYGILKDEWQAIKAKWST